MSEEIKLDGDGIRAQLVHLVAQDQNMCSGDGAHWEGETGEPTNELQKRLYDSMNAVAQAVRDGRQNIGNMLNNLVVETMGALSLFEQNEAENAAQIAGLDGQVFVEGHSEYIERQKDTTYIEQTPCIEPGAQRSTNPPAQLDGSFSELLHMKPSSNGFLPAPGEMNGIPFGQGGGTPFTVHPMEKK